ncbi:SWI2/SNF2 ATPase [Phytophthora infestans]|uniref:SWI2/SNF2 ATPase n=2 Tax=Phytophthora infestans TaxID=4787 RepID=A0A8S9USN7_PHYIN|nr:SWI2/SNF2 ATPase [Phytophthora infestans]
MTLSLEPLPAEWLVRVSRSKSKVYYYHTLTKKTQWSRPTPEDVAAANAATSATMFDQPGDTDRLHKRQKLDQPDANTVVEHKNSVLHTLIATSMRVGGSSLTRGTKRAVLFTPWPHQLAAVENIITAIQRRTIKEDEVSTETERFLLQHSTGAGKTLTIAALTHQLLSVKDTRSLRFHTIVVMLDRVKLNEQVGDAVETFLRRNGVDEVFRAESIEHLAKLLDSTQQESPQRVIITTTHKMGLLVKDDVLLTRLLHRSSNTKPGTVATEEVEKDDPFQRVAIITDEAHRSHTSSTRDAIEKVVKAGEGSRARLTFIGFTATPNTDALELFGSETDDGFRHPFHCYPIAQATADGRIMNILEDYTCVHCKVETSVFPKPVQELLRTNRGARRRVLDHASDDVAVLKAKALVMMTDFQTMKREHPKVKCMIVVRSRQDVVRYYKLIATFVAKKKLGWNCYAAFSGSVALAGAGNNAKPVTEQTLNTRSVTLAISDIVIVCDKLDTGYNEPLLACMYVDRYLRSSAHTVQLLSRLNRRHKHKPRVRVLDFANHAAQIRRSFADFWRDARAPTLTDSIDETAEKKDLVTAIAVLCDHFPELCTSPFEIDDPRSFVEEKVLPLERDAFQQVVDSLRGGVVAFKRLEQAGRDDFFERASPFSYYLLYELKKETESHLVAVDADVELSLDEIKTKMSARVQKYRKSFSGALYPQSLLDRGESGSKPTKMVSGLLEFGVLEQFEAFLSLTSARNNKQLLDSSIMSQAIETSSRFPVSSTRGSTEEEPRIFTQIAALRNELTLFLRDN